jgi:hypothetical protein
MTAKSRNDVKQFHTTSHCKSGMKRRKSVKKTEKCRLKKRNNLKKKKKLA